MRVRIGTLFLAIGCCLLFAPHARATDYAYGYTSVYVDSGSVVRGYHRTEVDYNTDVYYRPYACASLYKDDVEVVRACGGGFASATRNTQTTYYAGSTYSALTDHYVNIEYEEEDPYNPGYYYYPDYLGYYFSGAGSQPIDWYYVASGIYNTRPDESLHLGDTNAVVDPNRRILSITPQIIDESSQGLEVIECGRFKIITRYQVGCPPPAHTLNLTGHIEQDAILQSSETLLIQNEGDELCTYEITNLYKMKNRLAQTIGTGFTRYTARLTYRDITVGKVGPGISTRATIPGVGTCPQTGYWICFLREVHMFKQLAGLSLLLVTFQEPSPPTVHRVFVTTPYNASIIFEYANAAVPEGEPLKLGAVECLTSQLLATGLFSNAQITVKPISTGNVDLDILPTWVEYRSAVVVREISLEGFTAINEDQLRERLRRRGLRVNVPLLRYPFPAVRSMVLDSTREMYKGDFRTMNDVEETLSDLSFRIEPLAPQAVRLRIIVGKPLCE